MHIVNMSTKQTCQEYLIWMVAPMFMQYVFLVNNVHMIFRFEIIKLSYIKINMVWHQPNIIFIKGYKGYDGQIEICMKVMLDQQRICHFPTQKLIFEIGLLMDDKNYLNIWSQWDWVNAKSNIIWPLIKVSIYVLRVSWIKHLIYTLVSKEISHDEKD